MNVSSHCWLPREEFCTLYNVVLCCIKKLFFNGPVHTNCINVTHLICTDIFITSCKTYHVIIISHKYSSVHSLVCQWTEYVDKHVTGSEWLNKTVLWHVNGSPTWQKTVRVHINLLSRSLYEICPVRSSFSNFLYKNKFVKYQYSTHVVQLGPHNNYWGLVPDRHFNLLH